MINLCSANIVFDELGIKPKKEDKNRPILFQNPSKSGSNRRFMAAAISIEDCTRLIIIVPLYVAIDRSIKTFRTSTELWMLQARQYEDQVTLFKPIWFWWHQDHQTPAEKVKALGPLAPTLSQSCTFKLEKKSALIKPIWWHMALEKLQSHTHYNLYYFLYRFDGGGFGRLIFRRVVENNW